MRADRPGTEDLLLRAAEALLERDGPDGVTTRAVCRAAGVTAPTLYHHFGDKDGLLDALAARGLKAFLAMKRQGADAGDALADLRRGWEDFMAFALDPPRLFRLAARRSGVNTQVLEAATAATRERLSRLAEEGQLTTGVEPARLALLALSHDGRGQLANAACDRRRRAWATPAG